MLAVAIGAGVGIVNGLIVSVAKVHSFVVTLGMTTILRGFAVALNGGYPIPIDMGSDFINFGNGNVAGLSNTIIICIIAFIVCWFILKKPMWDAMYTRLAEIRRRLNFRESALSRHPFSLLGFARR